MPFKLSVSISFMSGADCRRAKAKGKDKCAGKLGIMECWNSGRMESRGLAPGVYPIIPSFHHSIIPFLSRQLVAGAAANGINPDWIKCINAPRGTRRQRLVRQKRRDVLRADQRARRLAILGRPLLLGGLDLAQVIETRAHQACLLSLLGLRSKLVNFRLELLHLLLRVLVLWSGGCRLLRLALQQLVFVAQSVHLLAQAQQLLLILA